MDWGELGGCKGAFVDPVVHETKDELTDEADDYDETEDLVAGVPVLALQVVSIRD